MQTNNTERIAYIDYLRVIACFLVMLVHASENFYGADSSVGLASNCSMLLNASGWHSTMVSWAGPAFRCL